jgi:hypothetical protein
VREKSPFLRHFVFKTISLPSQARDKHRENSTKRGRFLQGAEQRGAGLARKAVRL